MQVLYRKYRPEDFSEVRGQDHIVRALKGAVLSGNVGHAYMFSGPRGTGKTTVARLFAKILNCDLFATWQPKDSRQGNIKKTTANVKNTNIDLIEPCNKCSNCIAVNNANFIDLIEIDAASNRGIDEIRNIKESAQVSSLHGGYKVFIIDEAHMLTQQAFNALLKVLEEPPSRVMFILATTEPHKIIETILSRVQRFDFKKISQDQIVSKLRSIAKKEKINIEDEPLNIIAKFANGSLRDAENVLSKLVVYSGENKISMKDVTEILGIVPEQIYSELMEILHGKSASKGIELINNMYESGVDLENFASQFLSYLRDQLIESLKMPITEQRENFDPVFIANAVRRFLKAKIEFKTTPLPQLPLELAIIELTSKN